jgi:hypothetical protein
VPPCSADFQGPRHRTRRRDTAEDFLLRAELLLPALGHDEDIVDAGDCTWPVRDRHCDRAASAQPKDRARQRLVALGIKVRIGLIQHDEEWIAIERAGKRDTLCLSGRERAAMIADDGFVAFREAGDEIVNAGRLRGGDNRLWIGRLFEPAIFCATVPSNNSTSWGT